MHLNSGLPSLDNDALHSTEGHLITVAGARAEEASVLVVNMVQHMVFQLGARTLVLLPGQKTDAFEARLRGCATGIPHHAVANNVLSAYERDCINRYANDRNRAPLTVANPQRFAVDEFDGASSRFGMESRWGGVDLIVVDSVQMLDDAELGEDEWGVPRTESRIDSLSRASRALKHLAIKNEATVIAVCRRISHHTSEAEKARALAENSPAAFEAFLQDSDLVLELYPAKSAQTVQDSRRVVLIRKNRWGPSGGWVPLGMEHVTSKVTDSGSRKRIRSSEIPDHVDKLSAALSGCPASPPDSSQTRLVSPPVVGTQDLQSRRQRPEEEGWIGEIESTDLTSFLESKRGESKRQRGREQVPLGMPAAKRSDSLRVIERTSHGSFCAA